MASCPGRAPRRARPAVLPAGAAVLALHLLLLDALQPPPPSPPSPPLRPDAARAAMHVRRVPAEVPAVRPAARRPLRPAAPGALPSAAAGPAPPLYAARLPPALQLRWQRRGGRADGELRLDWQPGADGYHLVLADDGGDGWSSRGRIGPHGLEPERLVERRRTREVRAANFRRDVGVVSASGGGAEHALLPGAQDRAGWLLQLAAVVAAAPERFAPGAVVELFVVGTRGDAAWRRFEVEAVEPLDLPAGPATALRLASAAPGPYQPRWEVWLDPARGWLPVRWTSRVAETGAEADHRLVAAGS
ncbi:hypothetical protein [Rubrivivax sp. JA1026]|uniref:hypothetical protein n=1 Tax=Rubrivivax sp. JA1026 TaxID=2710888 RepID=UPI0013E92565|nr:hypothetical protein [Rubrivivax sp. JA1026]